MDINSSQGANAYTSAPNATPPVDNTQLREQNVEASRTELNTENTAAAQRAFEVTITQEAQNRLAADAALRNQEAVNETQATSTENQTNQNAVPPAEANQIVNIVA
ncbi:MAG: hypothetical protein GY699_03610 [Desulfobacteraceae bacterium]|nr:hypothetical protein [Desulfobacteraceae bacterium]